MRMRQRLAEIEATFFEEFEEEQKRAERQRAEAERRLRQRQALRTHKHGSMRFGLLVVTLVATAVIVTIAMFQALYYLLG
jgi:molybdopterin synthase catalytic subunit